LVEEPILPPREGAVSLPAGMARAQRQDHQGAIDDYVAIIDVPNGPSDVKSMALYNRALVYAADGDDEKATDDLNLVLAMAKTPTEVKTEARRKLERMKRQPSTRRAADREEPTSWARKGSNMIAMRRARELGGRVYEPTPKDIRRACEEIQATWSWRERAKRYHGPRAAWWTPPMIRL